MGQVSPGETIKGKVLIVKNSDKENKKIKKAEIVKCYRISYSIW
jgi:hypothetical protein